MADEYDVIIVGSGAGGGTLAHRLAPSGKRVLVLERGDWLPREVENWDATAAFVDNRYISPDTWYDKDGTAFQPQVHYFVGGATKFYGAALYRLREQDFGELKHHGGISPAWPVGYDVFAPYYAQAEELTRCTGPRRGPDRASGLGAVPVPAGVARAADPAAVRRPRPSRAAPVPLAQRHHARRGRARLQHVHPVRDVRRLPVPGARQGRRRRDRRTAHRSRHPNVTLLRNAQVRRLETDGRADRHVGRRRGRRRGAAVRRLGRRGLRGRGELGKAAARQRQRQAPERPGQRLGPGRSQLHLPQQPGVPRGLDEKNDTRFQKTLGLNDYYFGDADFEYPMGNVQMVGKSSAPMYRGEKPLETAAPTSRSRRRRARGRLLAVGRGPADPDNRVTLDADGNVVLATRRTTASRWSSSKAG